MDFQTALSYFAAEGRLVDSDPEAPIVLVNGSQMLVSLAQLITAAGMMARRGVQIEPVPVQIAPVLVQTILDENPISAENLVLDSKVLHWEPEVPAEPVLDVVCADHNHLLSGWQEVFCPFCEEDNTAGSQASAHIQERTDDPMTFHTCSDGKYKLAAKDGFCSKCRVTAPRWTNRAEMVEAIRQTRDIVLCWVDEGQMQQMVIGKNTAENRLVAAALQALKKAEDAEELAVRIGASLAASLLAAKGVTFKLVIAR